MKKILILILIFFNIKAFATNTPADTIFDFFKNKKDTSAIKGEAIKSEHPICGNGYCTTQEIKDDNIHLKKIKNDNVAINSKIFVVSNSLNEDLYIFYFEGGFNGNNENISMIMKIYDIKLNEYIYIFIVTNNIIDDHENHYKLSDYNLAICDLNHGTILENGSCSYKDPLEMKNNINMITYSTMTTENTAFEFIANDQYVNDYLFEHYNGYLNRICDTDGSCPPKNLETSINSLGIRNIKNIFIASNSLKDNLYLFFFEETLWNSKNNRYLIKINLYDLKFNKNTYIFSIFETEGNSARFYKMSEYNLAQCDLNGGIMLRNGLCSK